MEITMKIHAKNISKDDVRLLIQKMREWELTTKRTEIDSFVFDTEPKLTSEETLEVFSRIFPQFKNLVNIPISETPVLRLGMRAVVVDGEPVGTVEEITLNIGEASEAEMQKLVDAQSIQLVKMNKG